MFWAPGTKFADSNGFAWHKKHAVVFSARHADELRRNRWFKVETIGESDKVTP